MEAPHGTTPHVRYQMHVKSRSAAPYDACASMMASRESVLEQLEKVLSSEVFQGAGRPSTLLKYLVLQVLDGQVDRLKEFTIGTEALGKSESFDPRTDPVVRAEASRLRARLERYYAREGRLDHIVITLPKGSYAPRFEERQPSLDQGTGAGLPFERSRWRASLWFAFGIVATAVVIVMIWPGRRTGSSANSQPVRFDIELRSRGSLGSEVGIDAVVSPDGERLAYVWRDENGLSRLNTRRVDEDRVTELAGSDGARVPFFSPDGRWIGFWADGKLKKTALEGGSPVILCDATDLLGAAWGEDGTIVAALSRGRLSRISESGGAPVTILDLSEQSISPRWPQVLSGGRAVLYTSVGPAGPNAATIDVFIPATGERRVLVRGGTYGRILPNGYLTYVNQGTLFGLPVDLDRLDTRGAPVPLLDEVKYSPTFGYAQVDFARTGALIYRRDTPGNNTVPAWIDGTGTTERFPMKPGSYVWPRISPDGTRLAVAAFESGHPIVAVHDLSSHSTTRLTMTGPIDGYPLWTPDGRVLILGGPGGLAWLRPGIDEKPHPLTASDGPQVPWSFTPDGSRLAYHTLAGDAGFDLWTLPISTTPAGLVAGTPEPFLQTRAWEVYPTFSPDGRWLAYGSNESGTWEVYVRAFPDNGRKVQISTSGGRIPRWSPRGELLFYRTEDQRVMVTEYSAGSGSFVASKPREWLRTHLSDTGVLSNFDVGPDGTRIVALVPAVDAGEPQSPNHVTFISDFFGEIRRRVSQTAK
jgi:eukaryotic-like serine/threonine-protein kinase